LDVLLIFKREALGDIKINTLSEKETFDLLKEEAAESALNYEEHRIMLQKNNHQLT
jgi:hypothetical protein